MARPRKTDPASISPFHARLIGLKLQGESDAKFAERLGISPAGLSRLLSGGKPDFDSSILIANNAKVTVQWFMTGDSPENAVVADDVVLLPYLGVRPSAGPGRVAIIGDAESISMPRDILRRLHLPPEHAQIMRGFGSSMEPTIGDGDLVLLDARRTEPVDNKIFVFSIGDDLFIKRLRLEPGRGWLIISDNQDVPATIFPKSEPIQFYGMVVWTEQHL